MDSPAADIAMFSTVPSSPLRLPSTPDGMGSASKRRRQLLAPRRSISHEAMDVDMQGITFRFPVSGGGQDDQGTYLCVVSRDYGAVADSVRMPRRPVRARRPTSLFAMDDALASRPRRMSRSSSAPSYLYDSLSSDEEDYSSPIDDSGLETPPSPPLTPTKKAASPKRKPPSKSKTCVSCGTTKTPMWRDDAQGNAMCNACGIRFKKGGVRCKDCLYVFRKDDMRHDCPRCGREQ